jgi:hypothetical protein
MELLRWRVGGATVFRIADVDATTALQGLIPKFDPAAVSRAAWLTPDFVDEMGRLRGMVQAFLIMIDGQAIIVDPGVGNGKRRTAVPGWDNLHTDFLDRLDATGVEPHGIDHVLIRTCILTTLAGIPIWSMGSGRPTFPAARYVIRTHQAGGYDVPPDVY